MADFTFVTSNPHKVKTARASCDPLGISFGHKHQDLVEIQAENGEAIARHKVRQAFEACQSPVVITDDNWSIPGLRGFPGPYMRHVNHWFTPDDFIRLTKDLADRRIIMSHILAYKDSQAEKVFAVDIPAILLKEPRGRSIITHFMVISLDGGKHSAAEAEAKGGAAVAAQANAWHDLCAWLQSRN
jgi:inosine/xanthosine triphosphate pyrophosphatase family protein